MGCGGSRLGGLAAARAAESGDVPLPASGMRPLLRRRLEEMKKKSHANVLKGSQTLSTKELLRHGSSEDGEETEENDGSSKSSAKVSDQTLDELVEENKEVSYEKSSSSRSDDDKEVKEEKEEVQETHHDDDEIIKKEGDDNSSNHDDDDETIKKEGDDNSINDDDDDEEGRRSNFDERMICHGSPSFRVYCIDVASDDDEDQKDVEDTRKSMDTESVTTKPKEEGSIVVKKEKRERRGRRFGMGLSRKYLANVTAPCYAGGGGGGCMGNNQSRLVQQKSSQ